MQVILKKEVQNIGEAGDLVNVKDGYARNYLIPKNYAEIATEGALKNREQNIARLRAKQEKLHQEALAKAEQIEKIGSIELSAKAGNAIAQTMAIAKPEVKRFLFRVFII